MDLVAAALDYADAAAGHACQPDVARKALGWYARRGLLDDAISTVSKHVKALADANLDPGPALYRTLGASVVLHLANRSDVDAADGAFMTALGHPGFASSSQAKAAEDLLVAFKPGIPRSGDGDAFDDALVELLGAHSPVPVTYAGGAHCLADLDRVKALGRGKVDLTIGSALSIFGGDVPYEDVIAWHKAQQ